MSGTLFVVATPIGNLEDITLRALRVLREVAVIAAEDTRRTAHLLARHAIATPTTSLHEHNEQSKSTSLVARLQRGDDVALVSDAGTPTVSDPGVRLIRLAIDGGIRVEPIPGPSAIMAALAGPKLLCDRPSAMRPNPFSKRLYKSGAPSSVAPHHERSMMATEELPLNSRSSAKEPPDCSRLYPSNSSVTLSFSAPPRSTPKL